MTGVVVWFTGLPASGKSTLARVVQTRLRERGEPPCVLDGDVMRHLLAPLLGYSDHERDLFYEALAGFAAELASQGLTVLVPATAHRRAYRRRARELAPRFVEVWVTTPLADCRARDDKGLYAAAMAADSPGTLPGVGQPYDAPEHAE
ncbi:MAG TPA: adenylyl-sulfate kinase, partial [Polyangiaceae bacterium]|nr:adenylyl-sulfate kinase [Polyangiaceae bacterium]